MGARSAMPMKQGVRTRYCLSACSRGADIPFALDDQASRTATPLSSATRLHPPRSSRRSRDIPEGAGGVLLDHERSHDAETTGWELRDEAIATGLQATGDPQCITSTVAAGAGREGANAQAAGRRYCLPGQRVRARDVHAPSCVPAKAASFSRDGPRLHEPSVGSRPTAGYNKSNVHEICPRWTRRRLSWPEPDATRPRSRGLGRASTSPPRAAVAVAVIGRAVVATHVRRTAATTSRKGPPLNKHT